MVQLSPSPPFCRIFSYSPSNTNSLFPFFQTLTITSLFVSRMRQKKKKTSWKTNHTQQCQFMTDILLLAFPRVYLCCCMCHHFLSFLKCFSLDIYLKGREIQRQIHTRDNSHSLGFPPKWLQCLGPGQAWFKPGNRNSVHLSHTRDPLLLTASHHLYQQEAGATCQNQVSNLLYPYLHPAPQIWGTNIR